MIAYNAYNSTIKYKDNTDLQQFIEGTYLPDKVKTLEELDNIDIKLSELADELAENISNGKIQVANNIAYNDLAIAGYDNTIGLRDEVEELKYYNKVEHKRLKKLAKLAILSKFI